MLEPDATKQRDLRGGRAPWMAAPRGTARPTLESSRRCGVLVVGAGITGALMAEHLVTLGHDVCVVDRERPGFGSTAASTAMLLWEIDRSLSDLTDLYGFDRAADVYRRSLQAVSGLGRLVEANRLVCAYRPRSSLYLAAGDVGARALLAEHTLRVRAGLPGTYLDYRTLRGEFAIDREAAILSPGSADADPVCLAHALIATARSQGAQVFDAQAMTYDSGPAGVIVGLDNGCVIEAGHVVLATGYVMPDFIKADLHHSSSSWAIATSRQDPAVLWRDGVLIWEATESYAYARTTTDGRIILGGEDDDALLDPDDRDAAMPAKSAALLEKLAALCPDAKADAEFVWSGTFGETDDGLPLIGPIPGHPRLFAAYGYGGNGITFSYLASRVVARMIAGGNETWFERFAIDRPVPRR